MKVDAEKIKNAIDELDVACKDNGDLFDVIGILVGDFADVISANSPSQFLKQKRDCRRTLKILLRYLNNLTYRTTKKTKLVYKDEK